MSRLFLEIVPRTQKSFTEELLSVRTLLPKITGINLPNTKSCELHTIESIIEARSHLTTGLLVPHIRARDYVEIEGGLVVPHTDKTLALTEALVQRGIKEILVVQGDPHEGEGDNPDISPAFIEYIKRMTNLRVFGAIDQYRESDELKRIERKKGAGIDGFFTQPFFDKKSLEISMNTWHMMEICFGFAPVTTEKSKQYWQKVNNVTFPRDFSLDEEANIAFARENIEFLHEHNQGAYLMPVRFNPERYLSGVIG